MKYIIILLLTSCSFTDKQECEFNNGVKAFYGIPPKECK